MVIRLYHVSLRTRHLSHELSCTRECVTFALSLLYFEHAKKLIEQGKFVFDEKDMWSEHQPSAQDENEYLRAHGFGEYGKWYLGIDTEEDEEIIAPALSCLCGYSC